jgi:serine/threonine protein phosphatase PrpC
MAIIQETRVITVNIGDSRVVLGCRDHNGQIISRALTKDHSPDDPTEYARIINSGGRIFRTVSSSSQSKTSSGKRRNLLWGPVRVWLPEIDAPGLAMSRSLCDDVIHSVGVTSTLEFHEHHFDHSKDCLLIIATDGVWQYLSNQEAVDIALHEREPSKASVRLMTLFSSALTTD